MSRKKLTIDAYFSKRLNELIDHLEISQVEISKKTGITAGYLSMILGGNRGPSAEFIAGLHIHYSEYLDWLLTGKGEMIRNEKREGIRINVLRQLIEAVEEALIVRKLKAPPDKKAEFIAFLYEYFTETEKEVSREFIERHLKLVA